MEERERHFGTNDFGLIIFVFAVVYLIVFQSGLFQ
jgi:hypothetical protein